MINQKGFSLIELTIVLAIFLIVVVAMMNIFISMVTQQKKLLGQQELLNQTSYVMGYLSNSFKAALPDPDGSCLGAVGRVYLLSPSHCTQYNYGNNQNNGNGNGYGSYQLCSGVKFINSQDENACVEIFLDEAANPANPPLVQVKNGGAAQNLISNTLTVKYAKFVINGDMTLTAATVADSVQPRLTMLLDVLTQGQTPQEKIIQTTVSLRDLIQ